MAQTQFTVDGREMEKKRALFSVSVNIISEQPLLDSRLEIMDLMGRIIYIEKIPVINSIQISLPKISIGVYYLRIINAKESVTKKIIVD